MPDSKPSASASISSRKRRSGGLPLGPACRESLWRSSRCSGFLAGCKCYSRCGDWPSFYPMSSRNSEAGSTAVINSLSRALVQAT